MNIEQFAAHFKQRDHKLYKRAKLGKMNRLNTKQKDKHIKIIRVADKRGWLYTDEEKE